MANEEPNNVQYHPLDVAAIVKGQVLTIEELKPILGVPPERKMEWALRLLVLRQKIETQRRRRGLPVITMRIRKGTLVICDDSEAAEYNESMGKRGIRRFSRACARNLAVDVTKLTPEESAAHLRVIARQAMVFGAMNTARHQALPAPSTAPQRVTPKMVTKE